MRTSKTQVLPPRLDAARRRFKQWRRTRKIGSRIPEPLWAAAVKLAEAYGISATAKGLGVEYNSLKKRLKKNSASPSKISVPAHGTTFVELAAPAQIDVPECTLELEDVSGAKMRIHLKGIEAADVTALSRSLWGIE